MIPAGVRNVNLDMTTHCDRRCPNCCAGIGINRKLQHHTWEYFEAAAKVLYGIERVMLTGGEPTLHPQFAEFVPRFKELFGCKVLAMTTDGWGIKKHLAVIITKIDQIDFSDYGTHCDVLTLLRKWFDPHELRVFDAGEYAANFTPREPLGGGKPCERAWWRSGTVAYADGRLHGCCVSPGIKAEFLAISDGVPDPPCDKCWWSE